MKFNQRKIEKQVSHGNLVNGIILPEEPEFQSHVLYVIVQETVDQVSQPPHKSGKNDRELPDNGFSISLIALS